MVSPQLPRFTAPISSILHSFGIRILRYIDDWLTQATSREAVLQDLETVLSLCCELGIVVNLAKSIFFLARWVQYLGMILDTLTFKASPSQDRDDRLLSLRDECLSSRLQPASTWQALLGTLSSLSHIVPGCRLHMRTLQLQLHRSWDRLDGSFLVSWSDACLQDLLWWLDPVRLRRWVSLLNSLFELL